MNVSTFALFLQTIKRSELPDLTPIIFRDLVLNATLRSKNLETRYKG